MDLVRGRLPGSLGGDKPKNYGTGRRCACGTKVNQYHKGDKCGLCESDPTRAARVAAEREREQAEMLGRNKWKSKEYPDGCSECDEGEKFVRRHAGSGLCSLHYQRARKEAARQAEAEAAAMRNGDELDLTLGQPALASGGPVLPATIEETESLLPLQRFGTPAERDGRLEVTSGEPGYPRRDQFDEGEEGDKAYEYACEQFEGPTHTVLVERSACCGTLPDGEPCTGDCVGDVEPMQCCGQRPEGDADCSNCPLDDEGPAEAPEDEAGHPLIERAVRAAERASEAVALQSELVIRATDLAARAVAYKVNLDPEARAIEAVAKAMEGLDTDARNRVCDYVYARFYADK